MTTTAPQIAVRYRADIEMPPIPDRENGGQAERMAGHYQNLVLDLDTATLTVECSDWRDITTVGIADAELYPPMHWSHVPRRMCWVINSGVPSWPYLDAEAVARLLDELAPHAQRLAESLVPVADTTAWDWSEDAVHQGDRIATLVTPDRTPRGGSGSVIDMDDAVQACPHIVDERWAEMDDEQLDERADDLTRFAASTNWYPELNDLLGGAQRVEVIGTRAWLYGYRQRAANGREQVTASEWFALRKHPVADLDPVQLNKLHAEHQRAAAKEDQHLVGGVRYLLERQRWERRAVRDALEQDAVDVATTEKELERVRLRRGSRLARVLSWQGQDSDAELARLAGMSRQGVAKVRERFGIERADDQ